MNYFLGGQIFETRKNILWNNKEFRMDKRPVFYKNYFVAGMIYTQDLLFGLNMEYSFCHLSHKVSKTKFLQWAGLRHSIPSSLKIIIIPCPSTASPSFSTDGLIFDATKKRSEDFHSLLARKKAQPPNIVRELQNDFNFSFEQLREISTLPHSVVLELYVKGFQFKVINSILYTNSILYKIGFRTDDLCSLCKAESETVYHFLYHCPFVRKFWNEF